MGRRTIFFVSDQTGVSAETMGHSLLTQFDGLEFRQVTLPFISTVDKAEEAVRKINATALADGQRPIVFSTLVREDLRGVLRRSNALLVDFFAEFLGALETELGVKSSQREGRAHGMTDLQAYATRIDATNFALAADDGAVTADYNRADVILIGVSRSGKTPTCIYMAMQYGVFAANYPLTEDDFEGQQLPGPLRAQTARLFGLTIAPPRLQQIRNERRPGSRYASLAQCEYEVRSAEGLFQRFGIPHQNTTECSIEEIASRIIDRKGIERRLRP
ncbi:MAG TPA: pyruvate, water dikinase regulatory protein [Burkholderiales bacterium]|jgi:regulator of PEP synthase PpsR (kinase-PPPase family)|nr:pyruvate, water dikinase regulatory protein [Burkholderiales bacterium]